jgi:hypothetical protein
MRSWSRAAVAAALALSVAAPTAAAKKRKAAKPRPTPAAKPIYGPPAPTPAPQLRAAGSCLSYEADHFVLLAEVGQQGRMFRIGPDTVLHVEPKKGARIRLIYVETPDGPLAREVLPGPVPED